MTNYQVQLTPKFVNIATEGGQDSSVLNGKSYQRTFNMYEIENSGNRKMINKVADGGEFNDTTFQNSTGIGSFDIGLVFTASQVVTASDGYDENGFVGVGAVIEITPEQATALNSYGFSALIFDVVWADGSYLSSSKLAVFTIEDDGTFHDIAILVPEYDDGNAVCVNEAIWNMPVVLTNYVTGGNL